MKFFTAVVAALAGTALSAPLKRSTVGSVADVLNGVTAGTGVTDLESQLEGVMGGELGQVEETLGGIPLAGKLVDLAKGGLSSTAIQAVGSAISMVQEAVPIDTVNSYLNSATGGEVTNLEETLGANDLVSVLTGTVSQVADVGGIL